MIKMRIIFPQLTRYFCHRLPPPEPIMEEAILDVQQGPLPEDQLAQARGIQRHIIKRYFT
jgi:hypothetical protein